MCDFDIKSLSIDHNCNIIPLFFWFLLDKIDMNKLTPEIVFKYVNNRHAITQLVNSEK